MNPFRPLTGVSRAKQCCGNCDAFLANPPNQQPGGSKVRQGACLANPPSLMQSMAMVPGSQLGPKGPQAMPVWQGVWPPTDENRWCRHWQPEEVEDEQSRQAS